jgi:hypothetical protein
VDGLTQTEESVPMRRRASASLPSLCLGISVIAVLAACGQAPTQELTAKKPYTDLVGAEYRVVADDLYAYGICANWPDDKTLTFTDVIPGVGIGGHYVAFRRRVPLGTIIRIAGVWRRLYLVDGPVIFYVVALDGVDLPKDAPIEVELSRGNGKGTELNPRVYARVAKVTTPHVPSGSGRQ